MGQSESKQYGFIFIRTDKPFYYAGDTINGSVYLNVTQPYPGNTIYLKISG
jgi:hypothetical protein